MKLMKLTLAVFVLMTTSSFGQEADVDTVDLKIDGVSEPYVIGDLIQLEASVSGVNPDSTIVYDWKIQPEVSFKKWPDNSKIILGTGHKPEKFTVFLSVAIMTKTGQNATVSVKSIIETITVVSTNQQPSAPDKNDQIEIEQLGEFGKTAVELSKQIIITEFYSKEAYTSDAKKLAENFGTISNQLKTGEITTLEEVLLKTREFNSNFPNKSIWSSWFNGLSNKLSEANDANKLETVEEMIGVWNDISNGLKSL